MIAAIISAHAASVAPAPLPTARPNIVCILADNLGWADVGFNQGIDPTPNIDKLAREGVSSSNKRFFHLGELSDSQQRAWERTLEVFDERAGAARQMSLLLPAGHLSARYASTRQDWPFGPRLRRAIFALPRFVCPLCQNRPS